MLLLTLRVERVDLLDHAREGGLEALHTLDEVRRVGGAEAPHEVFAIGVEGLQVRDDALVLARGFVASHGVGIPPF